MMGFLDALFKKRPPTPVHTLKWPLSELRFTVPVENAQDAVAQLKQTGAKFAAGGAFTDSIFAKDYGGGAMGYFIVRTDDKTQNERLLFDGYMLQETEKLGTALESGPGMEKALKGMGFAPALERHVVVWAFTHKALPVKIYSVDDFGDFLEIAVPQTKMQSVRDKQQKQAKELAEKFAKSAADVIPTDVITLHYSTILDAQQQQAEEEAKQKGAKGGKTSGGKSGLF